MNRKAVDSLKEKDLFVHIGDAELRAAFPAENPTIAALYDDITRKQKHLAKLKILSERIAEREQRQNIPGLIAENERLKDQHLSITSENEESKMDLKIKEIELERAKKELEQKKRRNEEHAERLRTLKVIVERREKERSERAEQKDDYYARLAVAEDLVREKEAELEDLKNCLAADNRTIQEMETYFKKLTKRVFDKQSQFDKMRVGKVPTSSVIVNKTSLANHSTAKPSQHTIEANRKKNKDISAKLEKQLEETSQQASVLEEKWFELQDQLSDAQNALSLEQAKIKEWNTKKRRIQIAETLGRLEPKPTMYKRYLSGQSIDKRGSTGKSENLVKRKQMQMRENDQLEKNLDKEIEVLKVQIKNARKVQCTPGTPSSGASSTRSQLSLPKIPLNDAEKKTKQIIDEHTKEALKELKMEKQQIEDNIAVISTEVQNLEKEIHKLHIELKKETSKKEDFEEKSKKLEEELKDEDDHISLQSDQLREENIAKVNQKMEEIEKLLTERDGLDHSKLVELIDQAKVDENNLRNRYKTMAAVRNSYKEDVQGYDNLKQQHSLWVDKVNEAKQSLETIMRLRKAANMQNQIAKQSLTAVQPHFDEYTEYEALKREQRRLNERLKRSKSEGNLEASNN